MNKAKGETLLSVAMNAKEVFARNIDTLVAGFLIRHPDVLPGEIELVMRMGEDRSLNIVIERKGGIRFPDELGVPELPASADANESYEQGVANGWNKCIQAFRDINPPFSGTEFRESPQGFGDVEDAVVVADSGVLTHE